MAEHDDRTEVETTAPDATEDVVTPAADAVETWQDDADAALEPTDADATRIGSTWDEESMFRAASVGGASAAGLAAAGTAPAASEAEDARAAAIRREQERLDAERQARRDARLAALNPQPTPVTESVATTAPALQEPVQPSVTRRTTDKFLPSLGLFLLRLVVAAILAIRGMDMLLNVQRASEVFATTVLPEPQIVALVTGAAQVGIAIALVFGIATRLAGFGTALIAGGSLAFVLWGPWSPFLPGQRGFVGELELLLAAVGILFVCVGAGGWAIDRGFRARRAVDKAARANLA